MNTFTEKKNKAKRTRFILIISSIIALVACLIQRKEIYEFWVSVYGSNTLTVPLTILSIIFLPLCLHQSLYRILVKN